jgi:uncharacterized protein involved in exopolysaccharide biosynthesis
MEPLRLRPYSESVSRTLTPRDIVTPLFRHRRVVILSFLGILGGALLWGLLSPKQYQAQMKLLMKRERVDNALMPSKGDEVTEEDINSEVELLKSRDLMERVVLQCGLDRMHPGFFDIQNYLHGAGTDAQTQDRRISSAVQLLDKRLQVSPVRKTNLISVTYESSDPRLAADVLKSVADEYLAKHVAVYRVPGASSFFESESDRYKERLSQAEAHLSDFDESENVVAPALEKEITVQKLADFEASLRSSQVAIGETKKRIGGIKAQLATVPAREQAQIRTADNSLLLQQLKTTLLNLELKRTGLLANFKPDYRPVREVEKEIGATTAAIRSADSSPIREETTDRDPTHEWLRSELAKAQTELDGLEARSTATALVVSSYEDRARAIDKKETEQSSLVREQKTAEDNYLLYLHKAEEARISDALDQKRIVNVAVAESPTVPALPVRSQLLWTMLLGLTLATFTGAGLGFASDYLDPSLRTPAEVQQILDLPVLAALPEETS